MGKVLSVLQRQVYKFNAENRAHRVISKDKPDSAPKHETTVKIIERIRTEHPEVLESQIRKDTDLDGRLKHVFVKSEHDNVLAALETSRPLPQNRGQSKESEVTEYGYTEPQIIPRGRFTLSQATKFISDHQADPTTYTAAVIAKEYKLDEDKTEVILQNFKAFQLFMSDKGEKKPRLSVAAKFFQLAPGAKQADKENK